MKDLRRRPVRLSPALVPEELIGKVARCPLCGYQSAFSWHEKLEHPHQLLKPKIGAGHWVPGSFPVRCSNDQCQNEFHFQVPKIANKNRWELFGDEAARHIPMNERATKSPLNFFCITLVALHARKHDGVKRRLFNLKKKIAPHKDPDSWRHHFKDIWGSTPGTSEFRLESKQEKIRYAKSFAELIRDTLPELVFINTSNCVRLPKNSKEWGDALKRQRDDVFSVSLLTTLELFRKNEKSVNWTFDNIQDTTLGTRTEGWASECFLGLQYTRIFTWLAAGAAILEPKFVTPGSHFLLEIADFISYCIARDFQKSISGEHSEFPSKLLGQGLYLGTLRNGDIDSVWSHGLPLERFFGLRRKTA